MTKLQHPSQEVETSVLYIHQHFMEKKMNPKERLKELTLHLHSLQRKLDRIKKERENVRREIDKTEREIKEIKGG